MTCRQKKGMSIQFGEMAVQFYQLFQHQYQMITLKQ